MLILALLLQASTQQPLNLTCFGQGTANKLAVVNSYRSFGGSGSVGATPFSYRGNGQSTVMGQRQQGFGDQVDVRLFGGDDRIRMPRTMLPAIHGGDAGWFKLKKVEVTERTITATVGVNLMNNPKVHIDRMTGTISLSGKAGDYAGQCEAITADAPAKF